MSSYLQHMKDISVGAVSRSLARVATAVGETLSESDAKTTALVKTGRPATLSDFLAQARAQAPRDVADGAGTVVGAAAGALLWGGHRVLGLIGGASLGRNIPALLREGERKMALGNLSATGAGIAGSLFWRAHPVWGFVFGHVAGSVAAYFAGFRENT